MRAVRGFEQFRERGKEQLLNGLADNHDPAGSWQCLTIGGRQSWLSPESHVFASPYNLHKHVSYPSHFRSLHVVALLSSVFPFLSVVQLTPRSKPSSDYPLDSSLNHQETRMSHLGAWQCLSFQSAQVGSSAVKCLKHDILGFLMISVSGYALRRVSSTSMRNILVIRCGREFRRIYELMKLRIFNIETKQFQLRIHSTLRTFCITPKNVEINIPGKDSKRIVI